MYETDRGLVARMRAGDQRAFDEFFNSCAPRLVAFAARRSSLDATSLEDIVQNTLIKAVRNLASYRGQAALLTWITKICSREVSDAHRKAARRPAHISLDEPTANPVVEKLRAAESGEPIAELAAATQRAAIMKVLASMPEHYARALEAKYGDGLSVEDIARELGLTSTATQSLRARARETFRERWQAKFQGPLSAAPL